MVKTTNTILVERRDDVGIYTGPDFEFDSISEGTAVYKIIIRPEWVGQYFMPKRIITNFSNLGPGFDVNSYYYFIDDTNTFLDYWQMIPDPDFKMNFVMVVETLDNWRDYEFSISLEYELWAPLSKSLHVINNKVQAVYPVHRYVNKTEKCRNTLLIPFTEENNDMNWTWRSLMGIDEYKAGSSEDFIAGYSFMDTWFFNDYDLNKKIKFKNIYLPGGLTNYKVEVQIDGWKEIILGVEYTIKKTQFVDIRYSLVSPTDFTDNDIKNHLDGKSDGYKLMAELLLNQNPDIDEVDDTDSSDILESWYGWVEFEVYP